MKQVKVYGADWCSMTHRSMDHLRERGIEFDYVDVENDPAASAWVKQQNNGRELKPTIDLGNEVIAEPSNAQLDQALSRAGF